MKILLVGSGGREHAMAKALARDEKVELYGALRHKNPGIIGLCKDHILTNEVDNEKIEIYAKMKGIDLAVVGPEAPIEACLPAALAKSKIKVCAPFKKPAMIETSKSYSRALMKKYNIPGQVEYAAFSNVDDMKRYVYAYKKEVVVKPTGLTGGKGVKIVGEQLLTREDVIEYAQRILETRYGNSDQVLIEEKLEGEEFTVMCFSDGKTVIPMPAVQDHKRAFENDFGPNTGGMGAYSQADHLLPFLDKSDYENAVAIVKKTTEAIKAEGLGFKGFIYGQFMLTSQGPKVIEFNCRMGDPEAMNVLPLLETSFADICLAIANGELKESHVKFKNKATVCKYVVPNGYGTETIESSIVKVDELAIAKTGAELFYSAVSGVPGEVTTTSSRTLGIVGIADTIEEAYSQAEESLKHVHGAVFARHDIGSKEMIEKKKAKMLELTGKKAA